MKKSLFLLVFAIFSCKKQEATLVSFDIPDCVQMQINAANSKDCGANCLYQVVQYEYKNQDYYLMGYANVDWLGTTNTYLIDNQCDTICVRSHLDCDFNCGKLQNFFREAKIIKTVFGD